MIQKLDGTIHFINSAQESPRQKSVVFFPLGVISLYNLTTLCERSEIPMKQTFL